MALGTRDKVNTLPPLEVSLFFRQMSLLYESGIALGEIAYVMSESATQPQRKELATFISQRIDEGVPIADALEESGLFPVHAVKMLEIGQTSGRMDAVLNSLAIYYDRQDTLQKTIRSALTFPMIMLAVMFCVLSILIIKVLPLFAAVFQETGANPPLILRLVSESHGFTFALITVMIAILIVLIVTFTSAGKVLNAGEESHNILTKLPAMKAIIRKTQAGNLAHDMTLLLSGGILLEEALDLTQELSDSKWVRGKCQEIKDTMMTGDTFAQAVSKAGVFDGVYPSLLQAGEKAGQTDQVMDLIADRYTDEIDSKINSMLSLIEPTLVIVMSLVIGGILLSIMVPLMNIMTTV